LEQFPNQDPTAVPVGRHTPIFEPQSRRLWWFRHDAPCRKDEDGRNKIVQGVIVGVRKRGSPDATKDWKAAFGMSRNELARKVEAKANCRTVGAGKWQVQIATDPNQGKELEVVDRILKFLEQLMDTLEDPEAILDEKEEARIHKAEIPETEKEQLIKARRGQGVFKDRVEAIEATCRMTGVNDKRFLIASHIESRQSERSTQSAYLCYGTWDDGSRCLETASKVTGGGRDQGCADWRT
jgi:hypothetical protein